MDFSKLPNEFLEMKISEGQTKEEEILADEEEKIKELRKIYRGKWELEPVDRKDYFDFICTRNYVKLGIIWGPVLGIIGGIIGGFLAGWDFMPWFAFPLIGIMFGLGAFFVARPIYGAIIGALLLPIFYPIDLLVCYVVNRKRRAYNYEMQAILNEEISKVEEDTEATLKKLTEGIEKDISDYRNMFTEEIEKASVNYLDSPLVSEVAEWLTAGFIKTINEADRAINVEKIIVHYDFKVAKEKICNGIDEFDFEEHRCEKLQDGLTQAALTRAISKKVQSSLLAEYEMDISGTGYEVDISGSYEKSNLGYYMAIHMIYTAENGNYKPVQKW